MTQGPNRIFDEFAKLMMDTAGTAQGIAKEVETALQHQFERFLNNADIVKRDEFEAVREMAVKAREENDALLNRIEQLEAQLVADKKTTGRKTAGRKTTGRKTTGKKATDKQAGKGKT